MGRWQEITFSAQAQKQGDRDTHNLFLSYKLYIVIEVHIKLLLLLLKCQAYWTVSVTSVYLKTGMKIP